MYAVVTLIGSQVADRSVDFNDHKYDPKGLDAKCQTFPADVRNYAPTV